MSITANGPLQLVLFGLPRAGKTSLLAALAQVQESQPTPLPGKTEEPAGALANLRRLHYDEPPRPTEDETVSYSVRLPSPNGPLDAVLVDGDGKVPFELLKTRASLENATGAFSQAVIGADALLLVADASLKPENADKVLAALDAFLRRHEQTRGRRSDVVGLPVFLVLTKCDLLAQEGDTFSDWMRRVEEQKRQAGQRLQDFLDDADSHRPRSFGRLDIHVWATAAGRPALGANPSRPREPYGVAELFGQAATEAQRYRQRVERADARLGSTVKGIGGLAAALAMLTGLLLAGMGGREANELQRQIDRYKALEGKDLADRLHDFPKALEDRLTELKDIRADRGFSTLTDESRVYVEGRIDELTHYIPYLEEVLKDRFSTLARDEDELDEREKILREQLRLPDPAWSVTGAGLLRQHALDDIALLRRRAGKAIEFYQRLYSQGVRLREFQEPKQTDRVVNWREWQEEVENYSLAAQEPPDDFSDLPAHSLVTPNAILHLDRVRNARESILGSEDDPIKQGGLIRELTDIRDIVAALGLVPATAARPPLLVIRRKGEGDTPDLPPDAAWQRWRRLEPHPELATSFLGLMAAPGFERFLRLGEMVYWPEHPLVPPYYYFQSAFTLGRIPPAARETVRVRAKNYRDDVLRLLADQWRKPMESIAKEHPPDTLAFWTELARQMKHNPDPRDSYRRLAEVLDRLSRLDGGDPVADLLAFIEKPQYEVNVHGMTLTVPWDADASPADRAVLTIRCGTEEHHFKRDPDKTRPDEVNERTVYTFVGEARLVLRPGEDCEGQLPLLKDLMLTWLGSVKRPFSFLALSSGPRLHESAKAAVRARVAGNVELRFEANAPLPVAPELLKLLQKVQSAP